MVNGIPFFFFLIFAGIDYLTFFTGNNSMCWRGLETTSVQPVIMRRPFACCSTCSPVASCASLYFFPFSYSILSHTHINTLYQEFYRPEL